MLTSTITAATGFLLAVLWFDLMFDTQMLAHSGSRVAPDSVLASIAAYYRRVTTDASPMGRLVSVVMFVLIAALIAQAARRDAPVWVSVISFGAAAIGIGLAAVRVFGAARRLGRRTDSLDVQTRTARGILRSHIICLAAMATLLAIQLFAA
jgi:hypothetical protein